MPEWARVSLPSPTPCTSVSSQEGQCEEYLVGAELAVHPGQGSQVRQTAWEEGEVQGGAGVSQPEGRDNSLQ